MASEMYFASPEQLRAYRIKTVFSQILLYLFLSVFALFILFPFLYMIVTSLKSQALYDNQVSRKIIDLMPGMIELPEQMSQIYDETSGILKMPLGISTWINIYKPLDTMEGQWFQIEYDNLSEFFDIYDAEEDDFVNIAITKTIASKIFPTLFIVTSVIPAPVNCTPELVVINPSNTISKTLTKVYIEYIIAINLIYFIICFTK